MGSQDELCISCKWQTQTWGVVEVLYARRGRDLELTRESTTRAPERRN